jgi:hypothetical protein
VSERVTVIKRNLEGEATWRYDGRLLRRRGPELLIQAHFDRDDVAIFETALRRGDRFLELFYTDRWYNIFEIHDRDDDRVKGWYCNVGLPAVEEDENRISYVDLALDLWVTVHGAQHVLDVDEFAALPLDDATRVKSLAALDELKSLFASGFVIG